MRVRTLAFVSAALIAVIGAVVYETRSFAEKPESVPQASPAPASRGVPVTVSAAERRGVPVEIAAIGTAQASETVTLRGRIDGEIVAVHFHEGDEVEAGAPLFTLDSRAIAAQLAQAEANLARDKAQLENARRDLNRKTDLAKSEFATRAAVDQSKAAFDAASSTIKADEAAVQNLRVQLSYTEIRAPIDGRTGSVTLTKGNMVRASDSQVLVTINRVRPIKVNFAVPQKYFDEVRLAMSKGAVQVTARIQDETEQPEPGKVTFIDNQIDVATGTFQIKASFDNAKGVLWPGMMVNVVVRLGVEPDALVIPSVAVSAGQQGPFVFVVKPDQTTEVRNITVAREAGDRTVVAKGLKDGEQVVVDGQLRLGEGTRVSVRSPGATASVAPAAAAPAGKAN